MLNSAILSSADFLLPFAIDLIVSGYVIANYEAILKESCFTGCSIINSANTCSLGSNFMSFNWVYTTTHVHNYAYFCALARYVPDVSDASAIVDLALAVTSNPKLSSNKSQSAIELLRCS